MSLKIVLSKGLEKWVSEESDTHTKHGWEKEGDDISSKNWTAFGGDAWRLAYEYEHI